MADITVTPSKTFTGTESLTAGKLNALGDPGVSIDAGTIVDADVSATADIAGSKLADATVTKAKIEDVSDMKVLGNTSGATAAPSEVSILDEDDMVSDSATAIATQQSIKAYVDEVAGTSSNFTTEDSQAAGYQVFPSGLKMAWGNVDSVLNNTTSFPSGVGFTVPPTVQISYNKGSPATNYYGAQVGSVTTTGFTYKGSFNDFGPRYFAIGH